MELNILNKKEKENFLKRLNYQFGITDINGEIIQIGKERFYLFQGKYSKEDLFKLKGILKIDKIGVYFGKEFEPTSEFRLSIEGTQLLKNQIKKRIIEINEEQMTSWMSGNELDIKTNEKGIVVIKHQDYFLGCGKASEEKITNFIPKMRRLKNKGN
ncbi:MAG: hypothetical protein WC812_00775 [Candidatus Pacearchaeota archaeon]|jgi:NOL1/NOP2/fmu family ribosome biogenesis protein